MKKTISLLIILLLVTACAEQTDTPEFAEPVVEDEAYITATQTESAAPQLEPSSTADTRPTPEDWRDWPVIPEVTPKAREIYQLGLELGNDPHAFSKIADCHNVKVAFLGFFDHPGKYENMEGIEELQDTIDHFSGYFDRDGQSTQYGFNAAAVLSPLMADPDVCLPDETPLECEVRITRPTFALVSLEFWFEGRDADIYERYMRQIIEYLMEKGVVPILATKADNIEKDHSLNLTTARLAYEYDLPLWNWWAAAQDLANQGIDDPENDPFHLSVEAWNVRSKTFLQTLDHLWEGLNV